MPASLAKHQGGSVGGRRSPRSKAIGDWAEEVALAYLQSEVPGCADCVHRAAKGEKPGWDIDYTDAQGQLQRVEVKGTVSTGFGAIELTSNEMMAARKHGDHYWLCLVANCETSTPKIQLIQNPAAKIDLGDWTATAAIYSVRFAGEREPGIESEPTTTA